MTVTSTRAVLKTLPRPVWALAFGTFLNRFGTFVHVFLVLYLTARGYSAPQAGLALGAYGVGGLGAALLGGRLADRWGRRNTIVASMCGSAASMLALSQARGLVPIILLATASGLSSELYQPASGALLADLVPRTQRVTAYAVYRLAVNAGVAIGPAIGGLLLGRSFFLLFLGDALTSLVFAGIAVVMLPNRVVADTNEAADAEVGAGDPPARQATYEPRFLLLLAASALTTFVYAQSTVTLGLQVRADGFSAVVYGGLLSLNALLIIALELPLTAYSRRAAPHLAITAGSLLIAVGFGFTAVATTGGLLALSVLIWTFGEMVLAPVRQAYVAGIAPHELRGRYLGALGFARSIGLILASVLGTVLFTWNARGFWLICGSLGVVAAITVFVSQRQASARS